MTIKIYPWDNTFDRCTSLSKIGARNCILKEVSLEDTNAFLDLYHYQKTCNGQQIRYGLYYEDNLVGLMTFGYARFTNKAQYELLRLCFHPKYMITGGSQRLFKHFLDKYKPNSVISYCDKSKFDGNVYTCLGMKLIQKGKPREHYWRERDKKHITAQQLIQHGADRLVGTNFGKGTNNRDILLSNSFVIIKDEGQDAYLYLDESKYFGYIYLTTDLSNGKKYVGQHVSHTFDSNYFGSGTLLKRILKIRPNTLKVELLEWCKQDISEREIYYIQKYNTMFPNGYNLTTRKQWFTHNDSEEISLRMKNYYETEEGKLARQKTIDGNKRFYKTERGKQVLKEIIQKRKRYYSTAEGKAAKDKQIQRYKAFCQTQEGQQMCIARNNKLKALNETEYGKIKEQKRIQALRDFYSSREGKLAKEKQVLKYKENMKSEEYKEKRKACAKQYSEWAKTEEGKEKLKVGAKRAKQTLINNYIEKVNAMSDEEWRTYLKLHPRTTLKKYRK